MDMKGYSVSWTKQHQKELFFAAHHTTRQHQCIQANHDATEETSSQQQNQYSLKLALSSTSQNTMLHAFVALLLLVTSIGTAFSHPTIASNSSSTLPAALSHFHANNNTLRPSAVLQKLRRIRAHLNKSNKPASPDGDLIDCVLSHQQPAFDHPQLKGQRPLDPPERPKGHTHTNGETVIESFQLWTDSGEACPEGTVPIRRTTEQDFLRASSVRRFGRKPRNVRRDSTGTGHEVSPELYGDNYPRFFTYWTDPKHGHWWLEFGSGLLVGYWPAYLFSHLRNHASMVQFGGEIVNSRSRGYHTGTQMGSGHFSGEGFRKAAYFRNLQVVDWDNNLLPLSNIHQLADHSNCYDIRMGSNSVWGTYFYYGGPGRNVRDSLF
ncbi:hypothetical protein JHK85_047429 [Glycine max]|nr:hypothetical protein JHK85_047429 [Glycine max]